MLKDNWLNTVTSGSYKFTFMIVDEASWNAATKGNFNKEETLAQGKGIIVAEDGVEGSYAVQNVSILTKQGQMSNGYSKATVVTFDLLEPLGFGFFDRALTAGKLLGNASNFTNMQWILQLDFMGRDPSTGASVFRPDSFIYALKLKDITGTVGEAGAKYYMELNNMESEAKIHTVTTTDITVKNVKTVRTFAENLQIALNENEAATRPESSLGGPAGQMVQIEHEYKVVLGRSSTTQAQDSFRIPSFNLADAPWGGTADTSTAGAQSESLEKLGNREVTINNNTQLCAHIRELISKNVPSYAQHNARATPHGITYEVTVTPSVELIAQTDTTFHTQRKKITLSINLVMHGDTVPNDEQSIVNLKNKASVQRERFDTVIMPDLVKKYTYQYTGENTEVMDIDLNLNQYFFHGLSPAAAIYYADNHTMFEANIVEKSETEENPSLTANPHGEISNTIDQRFLSDIPIQKYNIEQSPVFKVMPVGPHGQQVNETTSMDKTANAALVNHAARIRDTQNLTLEVRGDPMFLGRDGSDIFSRGTDPSPRAIYMAFINFQPNAEDLLVNQRKGAVDMITTGIYKIVEVSSKFQQGSFTQTITTLRDANSSTFLLLDKLIELRVD